MTVTQTVTNNLATTLLQPVARLLSGPDEVPLYATLQSCTGALSCSVLNNGSGQPIGFEAVLPGALSALGGSSVVTYQLKILDGVPDLQETLQGQLLGLDFLSEILDGATNLIVDANSDAAVTLTATPQPGLLQRNLDLAVTVTNNGPGLLRNATISAPLPNGLSAAASGPCLPVVGQVICTVPTLAQGASTTMHFTVPLRLLSIGLPYTFTSTRTASVSRDLNPANDSASRSCTVLTPLLVNCT